MNIIHIIPIKKDKYKSINDVNNLRLISISNTFAQIFERLLMLNINSITNTHINQFGYKNKISSWHIFNMRKKPCCNNIFEKCTVAAADLSHFHTRICVYRMKANEIVCVRLSICVKVTHKRKIRKHTHT